MDFLVSAQDMRSAAWAELVASPAFKAFRAADNMVVELGGGSVMPDLSTANRVVNNGTKPAAPSRSKIMVRGPDGAPRLTQGDAAEAALRRRGPLGIAEVISTAKEDGASVGGKNPIANFRSAMSKDSRFYSFRRNGDYLWWLTGVDLPEGWDEAADDLLRTAASSFSSQEGGDSHAATMMPN